MQRKPFIPLGCDQQGRYTPTKEQPVKNITTPRTLSECEFTTGYPTLEELQYKWERSHRRVDAILLATLVACITAALVGML